MSGHDAPQLDLGVLRQVLEVAPSGVLMLDAGGVVVAGNARVEVILGRPPAEFQGGAVHELFAADERVRLAELLALGAEASAQPAFDPPFRLPDGRYIELRPGSVVELPDGPVLMLGLRDVSARMSLERERERTAAAQAFLAETGALLESQLDPAQTLQAIAALAVPAHAELCVIDLLDDDGALRGAAMSAVDPRAVVALERIRQGHPIELSSAHPVARVLRTGRPQLVKEMDDRSYATFASGSEHLELMRTLTYRSALVAPLTARGRTFGVISLLYLTEGRSYTEHDLGLLVDVARRAALALDNARLYAREHRIAETLQRSLLPARLPELPGLAMAARYEPGDGEIGGDWYDVVALPDGRVGCVVGDIVGRGIDAAATMGQLRNAVRAYAAERRSAAEVVVAVDQLARSLEVGFMATLVYLIVDRAAGTVELASAGHPPPLLVVAGGERRYLSSGRSTPIGVGEVAARASAIEPFPAGSTLIVYTDGLIERRGESLDDGLDHLSTVIAGAPAEPEQLVDAVVGALRHGAGGDDLAVLAIRSDA